MKTIGLIGGMSWESSLEYYRIVNETVREKLGGLHSAPIVMYSFDFADIAQLQNEGKWAEAAELMIEAAQRLEKAGPDVLVICTNTMHKVAEKVQENTNIPLLHIADAAGEEIKAQGLKNVGLLGTKFTMEEDFYRDRLLRKHGVSVIIPDEEDRQTVHEVIYDELCRGQRKQTSKEQMKKIIRSLTAKGAEGILLGCTEILLLVEQQDVEVPLFDTTTLHAKAAVEFALT